MVIGFIISRKVEPTIYSNTFLVYIPSLLLMVNSILVVHQARQLFEYYKQSSVFNMPVYVTIYPEYRNISAQVS